MTNEQSKHLQNSRAGTERQEDEEGTYPVQSMLGPFH